MGGFDALFAGSLTGSFDFGGTSSRVIGGLDSSLPGPSLPGTSLVGTFSASFAGGSFGASLGFGLGGGASSRVGGSSLLGTLAKATVCLPAMAVWLPSGQTSAPMSEAGLSADLETVA